MTELRLQGVSKHFGQFVALEHIDLDVGSGEFVVLLGPSGCGKTTVLRLISGLEMPSSGKIGFDGADISAVPVRNRHVGMVAQQHGLFPHMNVEDNIAFGLKVRRLADADIRRRVDDILDTVQLKPFRHRFPAQLSGGQMQRVAIARTLVTEPSVLLLDEPFASLDTGLRVELRGFIRDLQKRTGITTIFVTHDQAEAFELADRVAVLLDGRLRQFDAPETVYHRPCSLDVARFLNVPNIFDATVGEGNRLILAPGKPDLACPRQLAPGDKVTGMVHSECVRLSTEIDPGRSNAVAGVIRSAAFQGASVSYSVAAGGTEFRVIEHSTRRLAPGTQVFLYIPAEHIWLFPSGSDEFGQINTDFEVTE